MKALALITAVLLMGSVSFAGTNNCKHGNDAGLSSKTAAAPSTTGTTSRSGARKAAR